MPVDHTAKLEALRQLYDRVQKKEENIPEADFKAVGVKNNARLKDIEKAISSTKKLVSKEVKKETEAEIEKEYEEMAKERNMTVEDVKATMEGKEERAAPDGADRASKQSAQKKERAELRDKKETRRRVDGGDFDMTVDYV